VAFILPFETEISALDAQLAAWPVDSPGYADVRARLEACERKVYPNLTAYDTFLLSGHPLRPKALDYVRHIFHDVHLFYNPDVRGDHLMIAGQARLDINNRTIDVIVVGQQTGPSSQRDELLKLPVSEYRNWNQGMGFPDGFRKAVHFMEMAEQRNWPVVVFVDTPGADPSEYSEEEGQAFAINEVIHKTTSLRVPNLSYIISLGASGGAIAITAANRTIMNEYATHMVISPGGCASILFRNRSPESIRKAAEGLHLTSADALRQDTADEVVEEGLHPGHRYPQELLAKGKDAVVRNLAQLLELRRGQAERVRREKFFAMGVWGTREDSTRPHNADTLADRAAEQDQAFVSLQDALADYLAEANRTIEATDDDRPTEEAVLLPQEARLRVAQLLYAVQRRDPRHLGRLLGHDAYSLSRTQWAQIQEYALARRYGNMDGAKSLHPNGGSSPYRRLHPVDWIRRLTDQHSFREFEETLPYCSVDQLEFPEYQEALARGIKQTGLHSGLITGTAKIRGHATVLAINNFGLVGSSLCDEIGAKFRYAARQALETRTPLVSVAMGGGARMQEGTPSMHRNIPKAQHALNQLEEGGVPHISVIADPTLGGTAISYGLRGDYMIVVEGSANIGFSGKRVVEQFQQRRVAADFQQGAWLLRRGFVDEVVATDRLGDRIAELLEHVANGGRLADLQSRRVRRWKPKEEVILNATLDETGVARRKPARERRNALRV
jgi:acetyl-CoA carboxylase carboxyl transferase subunit alpha